MPLRPQSRTWKQEGAQEAQGRCVCVLWWLAVPLPGGRTEAQASKKCPHLCPWLSQGRVLGNKKPGQLQAAQSNVWKCLPSQDLRSSWTQQIGFPQATPSSSSLRCRYLNYVSKWHALPQRAAAPWWHHRFAIRVSLGMETAS